MKTVQVGKQIFQILSEKDKDGMIAYVIKRGKTEKSLIYSKLNKDWTLMGSTGRSGLGRLSMTTPKFVKFN